MWIKQKQDDVYFKMHCLYNAKTEIYDRTLTDERDNYDPTSAYINCTQEVRNASNHYALSLYRWCKRNIEYETRRAFDINLWKESIRCCYNLSAQGWIDLYEHLVDKGEYKEIGSQFHGKFL